MSMGMIMAGVFDRFPKLRLVIGHMGEAMPLLLYRFDWMQSNADGKPGLRGGAAGRQAQAQDLALLPHNIWITTSGVRAGSRRSSSAWMCWARAGDLRDGLPVPAVSRRGRRLRRLRYLSPEHKKMLMQTNAEHVFRLRT
jgi:hypothetical protein